MRRAQVSRPSPRTRSKVPRSFPAGRGANLVAYTPTPPQIWRNVGDNKALEATITTNYDSFDIDQSDGTVDIINADTGNQIYWNTCPLTGGQTAGMTTLYTLSGWTYCAARGSAGGKLHMLLTNTGGTPGHLEYARVSGTGINEQSPISRFSNGVDNDERPELDIRQSQIFAVWRRPATGTDSIMFGTLNLSGTIIVPATVVESRSVPGGWIMSNPLVAVTSNGVAHIVYRAQNIGSSTYLIQYARGHGSGFVVSPVTLINDGLQWAPLGLVVDASDTLHLFAFRESGSLYHAQMGQTGKLQTPLTQIYVNKQFTGMLPGSIRIDRDRTNATGHIYLLYYSNSSENPEHKLYLTRFAQAEAY